jgi:hypothetical protein
VGDDESELRRLNEDTFRAEAKQPIGPKAWSVYLEEVLDEAFVLRRSRPDREDEGKAAMLHAIDQVAQPPERSLLPDSVRVWASETVGVVASTVTLPVEGETKAFANVKVFARSNSGAWRCAYWQVSPRPLPSAR